MVKVEGIELYYALKIETLRVSAIVAVRRRREDEGASGSLEARHGRMKRRERTSQRAGEGNWEEEN